MKIATRNAKNTLHCLFTLISSNSSCKGGCQRSLYKNDVHFITNSCNRILLLEIVRALYQFSVLMMYFYVRYRFEYTSSIDSPVNDRFDENPQIWLWTTCSGCIEQTVDLSELLGWRKCHTFLTEQKSNRWSGKILAHFKVPVGLLWKY